MDLTFVTTNQNKLESLRRALAPKGVGVEQVHLELAEPQIASIRKIAIHKASSAFGVLGRPLVVQDAGFYLKAWNSFPGSFAKHALETLGLEGILQLVVDRSRACEFIECLAYTENGTNVFCFEASVPGTLALTPRGEKGTDSSTELWQLFIPDGCQKTLAEMTLEERDAWRQTRAKNWCDLFVEWYFGEERVGTCA